MDGLIKLAGGGAGCFGNLRCFPDDPAAGGGKPLGQGGDAAHAGAVDVDDALENLIAEILLADGSGLVEGKILAGGQAGGLHHGDLVDAGGQPLLNEGNVVLDTFREHPVLQPEARENVALGGNEQRMQAHRLQTGGVEEGQIQAGA